MSDEDERGLVRELAGAVDIGERCQLLARLALVRARRGGGAVCAVCAGSGWFERQITVRGMLAWATLHQRFPCPRCCTAEFHAYDEPAFHSWEQSGVWLADREAALALPPGDKDRERVLEELKKREERNVLGMARREEAARSTRLALDGLRRLRNRGGSVLPYP